jgi:hypothetical protein
VPEDRAEKRLTYGHSALGEAQNVRFGGRRGGSFEGGLVNIFMRMHRGDCHGLRPRNDGREQCHPAPDAGSCIFGRFLLSQE